MRPAEAGEFTRRAFQAGKMGLTEVGQVEQRGVNWDRLEWISVSFLGGIGRIKGKVNKVIRILGLAKVFISLWMSISQTRETFPPLSSLKAETGLVLSFFPANSLNSSSEGFYLFNDFLPLADTKCCPKCLFYDFKNRWRGLEIWFMPRPRPRGSRLSGRCQETWVTSIRTGATD